MNNLPNRFINPVHRLILVTQCIYAILLLATTAHAINTSQAFGIKFLGNTTDGVTGSAGVIPISGWNNITDAAFTSGTIYSSDNSASITLTRSGSGNTWNSGAYSDGGNGSLMNGYNDAHPNNLSTNVFSGLTSAAYDVYLYTGGDVARPSSATDWLPNYTVNGTTYYTATLKGYDAILKMIQGVPTSQNSNVYPPTQVAGHYIKIDNVAPVGGTITISANSDNRTYRSPLNGIEIVQRSDAPQILSQPAAHRLYTGGVVQFQVQAEGVNPLTYFWRKNGVNLSDGGNISGSATTNLTISNLAVTDTGDYDVVITNVYGSVTSLLAHLDAVVETQADAAFENWLAAYLVTTNGNQTYIVNSLTDRNFAFMWQQAYMIWMIEDTYARTQSPDQKQLINNLLNTFIWQNHSDLTWDGWDDDLEWGIIALVKGYQITGNVAALNSAIFNWNKVMSRGWDNVFGGGIWETTAKNYTSSKVVLCNSPQVIAGIVLYQVTGQSSYLTTSENIYAWTRTNMFVATTNQATNGMVLGQVNEGVQYANTNNTGEELKPSNNSYNSGLFAMSASALYQVTGNTQYLADAILAVNQKVNNEPIANEDHVANGDFEAEQLVRGVVLIANQNQNNLWPTYWPWLQVQFTAAWNERRIDYNITWNKWASATPAGTNDLDSMESESASLVQQVTPASMPGFVNCTNKLGGTIIGTSGSYNNGGNTIAKVFDGNVNTYFDAPANSGCWVGLDFGVGVSNAIGQINYWPRTTFASRMLGGVFQGDNSPTFPNPVTLFTITVVPPDGGVVSSHPITNTTAFRCVRYVGPANAACNVAELQFFLPNPPPAPPYLTNSWSGSQMTLNWPNGGLLLEATNLTGPWTTNTTATPPFLITPNQPQEFYRVIVP
jgi:predicted alpha-1,6-mannanase (GH76 family)